MKERKCWKCGETIFYIKPKKVIGGLIAECEIETVKPNLLRENKYWCRQCWDSRSAE